MKLHNPDLEKRVALIFGVANERSIAWSIAQKLNEQGYSIALAYQNPRLHPNVEKLAAKLNDANIVECDVSSDEMINSAFLEIQGIYGKINVLIHSIAYAPSESLAGSFIDTTREDFHTAMDISAYSIIPLAKRASELMPDGGSIITMTFDGSNRVYPHYNVMGPAKAALESTARTLASELGGQNIRVNAISAGPVSTLAARGIPGFTQLLRMHEENSPLGHNISPEDIAQLAAFLSGDGSSAITGQVLYVDCGYNIIGA